MAKRSEAKKYTDPELRERIKEEIKESGKDSKKGQWSARKPQLLTREYEKRGGGYRGEKDDSQKNLERWTEEEWQTHQRNTRARGDDGETKRYLPKKAWENMSDEEKRATEQKEREGSREGRQHVPNTEVAKKAREGSRALPERPAVSFRFGESGAVPRRLPTLYQKGSVNGTFSNVPKHRDSSRVPLPPRAGMET